MSIRPCWVSKSLNLYLLALRDSVHHTYNGNRGCVCVCVCWCANSIRILVCVCVCTVFNLNEHACGCMIQLLRCESVMSVNECKCTSPSMCMYACMYESTESTPLKYVRMYVCFSS